MVLCVLLAWAPGEAFCALRWRSLLLRLITSKWACAGAVFGYVGRRSWSSMATQLAQRRGHAGGEPVSPHFLHMPPHDRRHSRALQEHHHS